MALRTRMSAKHMIMSESLSGFRRSLALRDLSDSVAAAAASAGDQRDDHRRGGM
jgi:hypothetical protein